MSKPPKPMTTTAAVIYLMITFICSSIGIGLCIFLDLTLLSIVIEKGPPPDDWAGVVLCSAVGAVHVFVVGVSAIAFTVILNEPTRTKQLGPHDLPFGIDPTGKEGAKPCGDSDQSGLRSCCSCSQPSQ